MNETSQHDGNGKGWTLETLFLHLTQKIDDQKDYMLALIGAQEKNVTIASTAADKAVAKSEIAYDKRFEAANEIKSALANQTATLIPRKDVDTMIETVNARTGMLVEAMNQRVNKLEKFEANYSGDATRGATGRSQMMWGIGILVVIVLNVIALILKK